MKSPFPGVDPFVEGQGRWLDFHSRFTNSWCEEISERLPPNYQASIDERLEIREIDTEGPRLRRPDVTITKQRGDSRMTDSGATEQNSNLDVMEAVLVDLPAIEEFRTRRIEIVSLPGHQLVAVLELLSPTNKNHPGRGQYLARRADLLLQDVHLVELDLLLDGRHMPMAHPLPPGDFFALVARADRRPQAEVYAWSLRDPLPKIAIPLHKPDRDIVVDLAAAYATAYERARYGKLVNYGQPLELDLEEGKLRWAQEVARAMAENRP